MKLCISNFKKGHLSQMFGIDQKIDRRDELSFANIESWRQIELQQAGLMYPPIALGFAVVNNSSTNVYKFSTQNMYIFLLSKKKNSFQMSVEKQWDRDHCIKCTRDQFFWELKLLANIQDQADKNPQSEHFEHRQLLKS